jgi:hypothetical protein
VLARTSQNPNPPPTGQAFTAAVWAVLACPLRLALLIVDRVLGVAAATGSHAVVQIIPAERADRLRYAGVAILLAPPLFTGMVVAEWLPWIAAALLLRQPWLVTIGYLLTAPILIDFLVAAARVRPGSARPPVDGGGAVHVLGALAAWPAGMSAGAALLRRFTAACQAAAPVTVDLDARTPDLVGYYQRFGFVPTGDNSRHMRRIWTTGDGSTAPGRPPAPRPAPEQQQ